MKRDVTHGAPSQLCGKFCRTMYNYIEFIWNQKISFMLSYMWNNTYKLSQQKSTKTIQWVLIQFKIQILSHVFFLCVSMLVCFIHKRTCYVFFTCKTFIYVSLMKRHHMNFACSHLSLHPWNNTYKLFSPFLTFRWLLHNLPHRKGIKW